MERTFLSKRERELFTLLGQQGATKTQAAATMGITPHTVKRHLGRVAKRIGSDGTCNAMHLLLSDGTLPLTPINRRIALRPEQRVILAELSRGFSNPEIAARLGMTVPQVQYALKGLYQTLRANTRAHAIYRGHQTGHLTNNQRM